MESQMLSFQFTAFANIDLETAKLFVKSFDDNYNKEFSTYNPKGAPLFRVDSKSGECSINISLNRIDCFYPANDMNFIDAFLKQLLKFNNLALLNINRLAINYEELYLDRDFYLVEKINKHFRFDDNFGSAQEIMFRLNNKQAFKQTEINAITILQNEIMTNKQTLEDLNGIVIHYDINNKPVNRIDFQEVAVYLNELYIILINQQNKIAELLSNE